MATEDADPPASSARITSRTSTLRGVGLTSDRPLEGPSTSRGLAEGMIVAGKFALVRRLGRDGSIETFEAEDTLMGRRVALRALVPELATHPDHIRRFRREAHITSSVAHPGVVGILEIGRRSDGALYVIQELLGGPTLDAYLVERRRLPEEEALAIARPIAGALASAHALGIAHREITPANIVLTRAPFSERAPKLAGFRVGRGPASFPLGDPRYLAPEQLVPGGWIDGRSDVFSLGAVLYAMLAGSSPFDPSGPIPIFQQVTEHDAPRLDERAPETTPEAVALVHRCLARDSNARPDMHFVYAELLRLTHAAAPIEERRTLRPAHDEPDSIVLTESDLEEVELVDAEPEEDLLGGADPHSFPRESSPGVSISFPSPAPHDWIRATTEGESDFARGSDAPIDLVDLAADSAQRALRVNALEEAVLFAEQGITAAEGGELLGQLHLVRSIAELWLGRYQESLAAALAAMEVLPRGATSFLGAFGYGWLARVRIGKIEGATAAAEALLAGLDGRASSAQIIAACRVGVALIRGGSLARARRLVRAVRERMDKHASGEPVVHAWIDVAMAERALFVGDVARELPFRLSALERFTSAGDVRNACEQRVATGALLLRFGAYDEAERTLHEALGIAEPMKLAVASLAKTHLAFAAFRQGEAARALSLGSEALEAIHAAGDRWAEAMCQTVLTLVRSLRDERELAMAAADAAILAAESYPALLAHALGVKAAACVAAGRTQQALRPATDGMELLAQHGGAGEGESLLRLTHALVLAEEGVSTPRGAASRKAMKDARDRIAGLAERLTDPRYKKGFLEAIPEHARILQLGSEWLDDAG